MILRKISSLNKGINPIKIKKRATEIRLLFLLNVKFNYNITVCIECAGTDNFAASPSIQR